MDVLTISVVGLLKLRLIQNIEMEAIYIVSAKYPALRLNFNPVNHPYSKDDRSNIILI